ncbi:3-oxoacyl-ACP synthase [Candidatus Atribacteria bacterium HGW-Atribacteria-1]|nr:MAG: 3-oxoacyl-ACP synthase [Candidatus Atribacteria bacterium HGW-Atribacteria-1]
MGVKITNIEYYLPEQILTNDQLAKQFPDWFPEKIEKKVGIKERHIVKEDETALDLALIAGKKILENYDKDKIDFLLFCTQSPEYYLPSGACILQNKLGLREDIGAFDYNLGCSGFVYGLALAKSLITSRNATNILLITSETYTKYIHPKDKSNRTIFGDAAAATIIEKSEEEQIGEFALGTDGSGYKNLIVPNGGLRDKYDPNAKEIDDGSGSIRTNNNLYMNGPEIFNFTIKAVPKVVSETLKKNNIILDKIDYVIFHQANKYMNEYLRKKIGIPEEKYYLNLLNTGNTVSATIPIAIRNSLDDGIIKEGDKVLLVGFGVGYSWGGTIITI